MLTLGALTLVLLASRIPHSGATYDRAVLTAIDGAFARMSQVAVLQIRLFDVDFAEMVLVAGLVVLWSVDRVKGFDQPRLRRRALLACATCVPAYLICRVVQKLVARPRPILTESLEPLHRLFSSEVWARMQSTWTGSGSFPSDHAALSAVAAVIAFSINRRAGWFFAIFGLYTGFFRIATGYHWPSDVVGGFMAGIIAATVGLVLAPRFRPFFDRVLAGFSQKPALAYPLAFLFLAEFGHGFQRVNLLAHSLLHARLFH